MTSFFIPGLEDEPERAETAWQWYVAETGRDMHAGDRRVRKLTYMHDGDRYVAEVGTSRVRHPRRTGPRGGYIKDAEPSRSGYETGTVITAITSGSDMYCVWSLPPYRSFHNPTYVGRSSVEAVEYFGSTEARDDSTG